MSGRPSIKSQPLLCRTISLAALLLAVLFARVRAHEGHPTIPTTGATVHGDTLLLSTGARKAIGLQTTKVTLADMPSVVRANGKIAVPWRQHALVTTLIDGIVEEVLVQPGEPVEQGQVLAKMSSLALEQMQLDLLQAGTDFSHYDGRFRQRQPLADSGAISVKTFFETKKLRAQAAARLTFAVTKLKAIGLSDEVLENVRSTGQPVLRIDVKSPMSGTVVHADVRPGQIVNLTDHLFHVVDHTTVWCIADVLETDVVGVRLGHPVAVQVAATGQDAFEGEVAHIDITVDSSKRCIPVIVELRNDELQLRPGMSSRVAIQVGKSEQAIACPRQALIRSGSDHLVLLKRGEGKFLRRKVKIGRVGTGHVEILSGLFPGDHVITVGTHVLASLFTDTPTKRSSAKTASIPNPKSATDALATRAIGLVELTTAAKHFATSRIPGRIARIYVEHGQHVKAGQPLVDIESMALFDLQLQLVQNELERRLLQETLDRIAPLGDNGAVAGSQVRLVQSDVRKLKHKVGVLKRQLDAIGLPSDQISGLANADPSQADFAKRIVPRVTLAARHNGHVADFNAVPGQAIATQDQLVEVHDLSRLWVKAFLFEQQAPRVRMNQQVEIRFAADSGLCLQGQIVRMAPTSNEGQRVFPLWIEMEDPARSLREGMLAHVRVLPPSGSAVSPTRVRPAVLNSLRGE